MKKIVFGRRPKVYLPEITAYVDYINNNLKGWVSYDSKDIDDYNPNDFDAVWRFMGFDMTGKGQQVIHEYNSLSTGQYALLKNNIKKFCNSKPDARVFLNRAVRSHFSFHDGVPEARRDMGVDNRFFTAESVKKKYDFVYAGSLSGRGDTVFRGLSHFKDNLKEASIIVIGNVPDEIHEAFSRTSNITFTGQVPYQDIPKLAKSAEYGINFMPDIYPLNAQTATKVLEYCALGLKIVTSDYKWSRKFERRRHAKFFFLDNDFKNFNLKNIQNFDFVTPNVRDLEWNSLIKTSGVFDLLK